MYPSEQYIDPKSIISKIRQQIEEKVLIPILMITRLKSMQGLF